MVNAFTKLLMFQKYLKEHFNRSISAWNSEANETRYASLPGVVLLYRRSEVKHNHTWSATQRMSVRNILSFDLYRNLQVIAYGLL